MRAGDRVKLPGGGTARVIAPRDAAGIVLVRLADATIVPVPAEHLRHETTDELAARAALRPRTGRVLNLGPVRPSPGGSPRPGLAGTDADCGTDAALLRNGEPGLGGAHAQRSGLAGGGETS